MSVPFFRSRRAKRFAELLEEATGQRRRRRRRSAELDGELAQLVDVAVRMRSLAALAAPSDEYRREQRAALLAQFEREGIGGSGQPDAAARSAAEAQTQVLHPVTARTGRARAALLIGLAAGALAVSGVAAASTDSLPGDPLYSLKRSSELARISLASSEYSRGQLYLELAAKRLAEATALPTAAAQLLADVDESTVAGVSRIVAEAVAHRDASALAPAELFVARQEAQLRSLAPALSGAAAQRGQDSRALLAEVQDRLARVREALACGCPFPSADHLGPVPACS